MAEVRLDVTHATELAEMRQFLSQWLARDPTRLAAAGFTLPDDAEDAADPLEVFRAMAQASDDAAVLAQHVLTALEVRAVKTAQPTRGSADLIITALGAPSRSCPTTPEQR